MSDLCGDRFDARVAESLCDPREHHEIKGDLILAITPGGLTKLISDEVYVRDPSLGNVRYLSAQPMASVELHFKKGKWLPDISGDVTVLVDAKYQMTFLDYSQVWQSPPPKSTFKEDPVFAQAVQNYESAIKAMQEHKFEKAKTLLEKIIAGGTREGKGIHEGPE